MIVYGDLMLIVNAVADYLILTLVRQDLFPQIKKLRVAKGAVLSSITYIFWYCFQGFFWRRTGDILAAFVMIMILLWTYQIRSFCVLVKAIGATFCYVFVMGGFSFFLYGKLIRGRPAETGWWWISLMCMGIFTETLILWKKIKRVRRNYEKNIYEVEIHRLSGSLHCRGIYDSGNLLVSQVTGRGVCVISMEKAEELLNEEEKKILSKFSEDHNLPWEKMTENLWSGMYPICFSTVENKNAWMPGVIADHIIVRKNEEVLTDRRGMIGISAERISKDGKFSVLLPEDIFS